MSVIAPKFRLGYLIKGITDNIFWIIILVTLIAIPVVQIVLIYIDFPIIDGEIWNPFRVLDAMTHPERALPLVKSFMQTDLFKVVAFPGFGFAALIAAAVIFVERKMLAKLQLRVGPFYCGKVEGILQLMGDGLKLISKEIIIPAKADKPLFWAAPVLFAATAAAFVALIPVAPGWVVADIDLGLLAVFAVIGFFPIITIVSAWSANSKFPFIGGIRALFQMVSFEIPLILSLLGIVMLTGTLNLSEIVESQASFPWIIFMPIGAIVFFICILAELERIPFDLPEAETELTGGFHTEYSGMKFGVFQAAEFGAVLITSALISTLFLKGWEGPFLPSHVWFLLKLFFFAFIFIWIRATLPRLRIDQIMAYAWKFLLPLSLINIFVVAAEILLLGEQITDSSGVRMDLTAGDMWIMAGINVVVAIVAVIGLSKITGMDAKESTKVASATRIIEGT